MITTFSDVLFDRLGSGFRDGGPVDRERFGHGVLPIPISHFLEQTLDQRVEREAAGIADLASAWVDSDREEIRLGREAYVRLLARHAHFPADEWPGALRQATLLVSSHLVRPVSTLVQFVFGDDHDALPSSEVERRVSYFVAYSYLRTAVSAYVQKHRQESVTRSRFHDMLQHVDRAMSADWTPEEWATVLGPLDRLARDAGYRGIPVPLVETFFDAKDNHVMAARLRTWAQGTSAQAVASDDLSRILEPEREPVRPSRADADATGKRTEPESATTGHASSAASNKPEAPEPSPPVPLWKQFTGASAVRRPEAAEPAANLPLWKKFRTSEENEEEPAALAALEKDLLGTASERRAEFVRELFGGSAEAYGRLLGALRLARDWPEASRLLADEVFRKNRVDIYSKAAIAFTNAVEERFRPVR